MKIGQKLVLGFILVSMLVGVVGYISINTSRRILQESIGDEAVVLATNVLDGIDRNIYRRIEIFQEYSTDTILQEGIDEFSQIFEKLDDVQAYISEKDRKWSSDIEVIMTPFMHDLIYNKVSEELRDKIEFYEKKYGYKVFGEVFVTNNFGANIGQTGRTSDYYQADEEWWQVAKRDGVYVRGIEYDDSAGIYSTDIGIRVDDENGNFIGVLKVVLNIEEVISAINDAVVDKKYETAKFKLITNESKIIYDSEGTYDFLDDMSREKYLKEFTSNSGYCLNRGVAGKSDKLIAYVRSDGYRDYRGLGWMLIVEYEAEEIFIPVARLRSILLTISLVVAMIGVLIGLIFSRSISVPLGKLKNATIEIGKGKLDTRIKIVSKDEIGQLAFSFNKMSEDLQKSNYALHESQERLQAIIDNSTAIIYLKDTLGRYILINRQYETLFNISKECIIDKTDYDIFPKEIADAFQRNDGKVLETEHPLEFEEIVQYRDVLRSYISLKFPLANTKDVIYGICGISTEITKRKHAEEQIKASLKEKEVLLNEVNHRVKNNLQIILSLLDMSSMQAQNQETIEMFAEAQNRVASISFIHSQLYESEKFDEIDMGWHIKELSWNLLKAYSKEETITLDIKSTRVLLPVTQAVPCALVLNELISNSLKHAYLDGQQGTISISMKQSNNSTILAIVKDNGVGIPDEIDIEKAKSLGLKLVRNIVYKQLNGIIKCCRSGGTEFTVEFKCSKEIS